MRKINIKDDDKTNLIGVPELQDLFLFQIQDSFTKQLHFQGNGKY